MSLGEAGADYVSFGIIPPATGDASSANARAHRADLIAWWAPIFEVPCVAFDVGTVDEVSALAEAGADLLIPHLGLTTKGMIGATSAVTLEDGAKRVQAMHDAAKRVNQEILVLCHGGPIAEPADAQYILDHTEGIVGFYGASSMERLPTEIALTEQTRKFKAITF